MVPNGFGFAVISNDNLNASSYPVLFHSDSKRNLRENFFQETRGNENFASLLFSRQKGFVDATYWGFDHRMYVAPVTLGSQSTPLPWTLVVFANKSDLQTINLVYLSVSIVVFGAYALVMLVIFLLGVHLFRSVHGGLGGWLWPDPTMQKRYILISCVHVVLIICCTYLLESILNPSSNLTQDSYDAYIVGTASFPIIGLLLTFALLKMKWGDSRPGKPQ